jgi:hypothetical protein
VQHPYTEIPQQESAILAHTTKTVVSVIASPWIEAYSCYPGMMALAPSDNRGFRYRPYGYEIILASSKDIFAIRRPTYTNEPAIITLIDV